jgi:hypothetical protein
MAAHWRAKLKASRLSEPLSYRSEPVLRTSPVLRYTTRHQEGKKKSVTAGCSCFASAIWQAIFHSKDLSEKDPPCWWGLCVPACAFHLGLSQPPAARPFAEWIARLRCVW